MGRTGQSSGSIRGSNTAQYSTSRNPTGVRWMRGYKDSQVGFSTILTKFLSNDLFVQSHCHSDRLVVAYFGWYSNLSQVSLWLTKSRLSPDTFRYTRIDCGRDTQKCFGIGGFEQELQRCNRPDLQVSRTCRNSRESLNLHSVSECSAEEVMMHAGPSIYTDTI